MWRYVFIGVALISFATQAPSLLQKQIDDNQGEQSGTRPDEGGREIARVSVARAEDDGFNPLAGRVARINRDRSGHYLARARMNGRSYDVLVDTGATMVAINESTARRLGIHLTNADFRYKVNTANGIAEAAKATIDEIENAIDRQLRNGILQRGNDERTGLVTTAHALATERRMLDAIDKGRSAVAPIRRRRPSQTASSSSVAPIPSRHHRMRVSTWTSTSV